MNNDDRIHLVQEVLSEHNTYWNEQRSRMKAYRDAYDTNFWKNRRQLPNEIVSVEVAEAYAFVESLQSSLFTRSPGVEIEANDIEIDQINALKHVTNKWLRSQRNELERASRLAVIFTHSFMKVYDCGVGNDPFMRLKSVALPPWDVIVDFSATDLESSRWLAHRYYIPVSEAKAKFGNVDWLPRLKKDFFDSENRYENRDKADSVPASYLFVEMCEFYDILNDQMFWYSADVSNGPRIFDKSAIYPRTVNDTPFPSLIPFYYCRTSDRPLIGYSSIHRIYDQIIEKNILRTWWANAVRRDSRQYLFDRSKLDEEVLSKVTAGIDGALIGVDGPITGDMLVPVPVPSITTNHDRYLNNIESDIQRGTILAAFASGQAVKTTATEVNVLAQYTASELGKLARERDMVIERLSLCYIRMLMADIDQITPLSVGKDIVLLKPETFDSDIYIAAVDGASTPVSRAIKQERMLGLMPILKELGVDPQKIKEEIIRLFDLPEIFLVEPEKPEEEPLPPGSVPGMPDEQTGGFDQAVNQMAQGNPDIGALLGGMA
jgi:hypothetical protein